MKAARKVGHRRQPVQCGHPRNPPPTWPSRQRPGAMWRRTGRQRAVAGERRRGRPYGADVPTLTSPDFILTSGAQVAPTVEPRPAGLGRRRRDGGPGPTKPVRPLTPPRRGASSLACTYPPPPRNPPLQGRRASDPAKAGIHRAGRRPSPHMAVAASDPREERRPHARRWTQTPPCWRSSSVPPPGATPFSPICGRHPLGQPAQQGTQTAVNQRRIIQQPSARAPSPGNNLLFYPPASFKRRQKNTKQSYTGGLIIRHVCSPRPPSSSTPRPRNPPPLGRRASDRQRPPAT